MSLRQTAAWARLAGVADLTDASLCDRLHQSCDFLGALVAAMLGFQPDAAAARWSGRSVRIADRNCVSKPGGKFGASGTDWRIHAGYDLGAGGFRHLDVTDARGAEALDRGAPVAGEIRIRSWLFQRQGHQPLRGRRRNRGKFRGVRAYVGPAMMSSARGGIYGPGMPMRSPR